MVAQAGWTLQGAWSFKVLNREDLQLVALCVLVNRKGPLGPQPGPRVLIIIVACFSLLWRLKHIVLRIFVRGGSSN